MKKSTQNTTVTQKTKNIAELYTQLIKMIGEDITRKDLLKTPLRAAKAFQYLMQGYHLDVKTVVNDALFTCDNRNMVIVKDIELFSICEHHLLPIIGKCHIGYLPNGQVLGLSKIARIVDIYAKRCNSPAIKKTFLSMNKVVNI